MKTCKDCIHYDVCTGYLPSDLDQDVWDLCAQGKSDEIPDIEERCDSFKDKSKFIEKPFGPRDEIYIITKYSYSSPYEVIKCIVSKMSLKDGNTITFSCYGLYANNKVYRGANFKTSSIGKTVFLTREAAEKKLGELNEHM